MQKMILFLIFVILISSCATINRLNERVYGTYIEINDKNDIKLIEHDFTGKNKIILQIQTDKIPESFINNFHNTFTPIIIQYLIKIALLQKTIAYSRLTIIKILLMII